VSAIGVQKMHATWMQVLAGAAVIAVYAILAQRAPFSTAPIGGRPPGGSVLRRLVGLEGRHSRSSMRR
jgi:hypothetical protein